MYRLNVFPVTEYFRADLPYSFRYTQLFSGVLTADQKAVAKDHKGFGIIPQPARSGKRVISDPLDRTGHAGGLQAPATGKGFPSDPGKRLLKQDVFQRCTAEKALIWDPGKADRLMQISLF